MVLVLHWHRFDSDLPCPLQKNVLSLQLSWKFTWSLFYLDLLKYTNHTSVTATNYKNSPCTTQEADLLVSVCQNRVLSSTPSLRVSILKPNCINAILWLRNLQLVAWTVSSLHLFSTLPLFLSPPMLLYTPKLPSKCTVYPGPIQMIDSASCRIGAGPTFPASRSADLKHLSGIIYLIQINPPVLTLSLRKNGLTRMYPMPSNHSYSPSLFFLFSLFSGSQQDSRLVLVCSIHELTSALCVLFCEWLKMAGY